MTFMPFIGLQTFKVKFSENSLWSNILNHLQTKVTPKNPHSCIFFSMILEFWETYFFSFRLADYQKSFNAACNYILLHFCATIMHFFIILKCSVFFLLITSQKDFPPAKYRLCWICTSNKNKALKFLFSSHFLEFTLEQVLKSFSDRTNSLKPHVVGFFSSRSYDLQESRELWILISWVLGY